MSYPDNTPTPASRDTNPDPITGAPGSHPVGTGIGAAGAGATGAAIGAAVGGPVGAVVGATIGAVAGGAAGHGVAEAIDPTAHDAYWRENHARQSFAGTGGYDQYRSAYRTGYMGAGRYGSRSFDESENELRNDYESAKDSASVSWEHAKHATRAAFDRAGQELRHVGQEAKRAVT
ncbi:MAG: hypothetical protein JO295_11190 [Verrucomicrobia bacterium]|nr:hypothetical protein [Verrucomicrobiota bacterium]